MAPYTLTEAQRRQAELIRASAEGREPDYSDANLALYDTPPVAGPVEDVPGLHTNTSSVVGADALFTDDPDVQHPQQTNPEPVPDVNRELPEAAKNAAANIPQAPDGAPANAAPVSTDTTADTATVTAEVNDVVAAAEEVHAEVTADTAPERPATTEWTNDGEPLN